MTAAEAKERALEEIAKCGVRSGQLWKHHKGEFYVVRSVGLLEASLDAVVNYADKDGVTWTRTLAAWLEVLESGDQRFTLACCDPARCPDHIAHVPRSLMTAAWCPKTGRYL